MLIQNPSVSAEESESAKHSGYLTLAGLSIDNAINNLYSSPLSLCRDGVSAYQRMLCLYIYLYAAETWCVGNCQCFMSEAEYIAIIGKIEELQQECCDFRIEGSYTPPTVSTVPGSEVPVSTLPSTFIMEFNVDEPILGGVPLEGQTSVTHPLLAGFAVTVIRGLINLPGIVMPDDQYYFSKSLGSATVNFSHPLVKGEYIKITTIPL